jgi:DNA polymerase I
MYPEIKQEIEEGKLLLEWDRSKGEAPAPLLKDKYASERKKAKTMNFSIAYGKTQQGFALDWGVSTADAKKVIDLWYQERQEVKTWQNEAKQKAMVYGFT